MEQQKGTKSWYLKLVFSPDRPTIWGLGSTTGLPRGVSPAHTLGAKPAPATQWKLSWIFSQVLLKEAFSENPGGPEGTRGSFGSSSDQQDVQLVTCGQGIRESYTLSLPLATGPTGQPSPPFTRLSPGEYSEKFASVRPPSINAPLPEIGGYI